MAAEYEVSSWVVWSQLVNWRRISRDLVLWLERDAEDGEGPG